jgi:hypothetical protein
MEQSGPFGLWMGMKLDDLAAPATALGSSKFRVDTVPKPHPAFQYWIVRVTPRQGLSWIKAIGKPIATNTAGHQLIAAFDDLERRLSKTYGNGQRTGHLLPDSIWSDPGDWMAGLLDQDRTLMTIWSPEHGSRLPDPLTMVGLLAEAEDTTTGWLGVEYYFENEDEAAEAATAAEDEVL